MRSGWTTHICSEGWSKGSASATPIWPKEVARPPSSSFYFVFIYIQFLYCRLCLFWHIFFFMKNIFSIFQCLVWSKVWKFSLISVKWFSFFKTVNYFLSLNFFLLVRTLSCISFSVATGHHRNPCSVDGVRRRTLTTRVCRNLLLVATTKDCRKLLWCFLEVVDGFY
jgi:hypothetical protein